MPIQIFNFLLFAELLACLFLPPNLYLAFLSFVAIYILTYIFSSRCNFFVRFPPLSIAYLVYICFASFSLIISILLGFPSVSGKTFSVDYLKPFAYILFSIVPIVTACFCHRESFRHFTKPLVFSVVLSSVFSSLVSFEILPFWAYERFSIPRGSIGDLAIVRNVGSSPMDPSVYAFFVVVFMLYLFRTAYWNGLAVLGKILISCLLFFSVFLTLSKSLVFLFTYCLFLFTANIILAQIRTFSAKRTAKAMFILFIPTVFVLFSYFWGLSSFANIDTSFFSSGAVQSGLGRINHWAFLLELSDASMTAPFIGFGFKSPEAIFGFGSHSQFVQSYFELGSFSILLLPVIFFFSRQVLLTPSLSLFDKIFIVLSAFIVSFSTELFFSRLFIFLPLIIIPSLSVDIPFRCRTDSDII